MPKHYGTMCLSDAPSPPVTVERQGRSSQGNHPLLCSISAVFAGNTALRNRFVSPVTAFARIYLTCLSEDGLRETDCTLHLRMLREERSPRRYHEAFILRTSSRSVAWLRPKPQVTFTRNVVLYYLYILDMLPFALHFK